MRKSKMIDVKDVAVPFELEIDGNKLLLLLSCCFFIWGWGVWGAASDFKQCTINRNSGTPLGRRRKFPTGIPVF